MTREVGKLWVDIPLELDWDEADVNDTDLARVAEILKRLEFNSLVRRLPRNMQQPAVDSSQDGLFTEPDAIKPLQVGSWSEDVELVAGEPVFIDTPADSDELWLAIGETAYRLPLAEVKPGLWERLSGQVIVGYDLKASLHSLAAKGISLELGELHDIRQAAFLINPLTRDRSLTGLVGESVDASQLGQVMSALKLVYQRQLDSFEQLPKVARIAHSFDFPLVPILFKMEHQGIKIDPDQLAMMSQELGEEHAKLEQEMYGMAGYEFNIGSPAQLSEVLFTKLQLPTAGIKKGKTGYSTGQKE